MATTVTPVYSGVDTYIVDVTATEDLDAGVNIPFTQGFVPGEVTFCNLQTAAALKGWFPDAVSLNLVQLGAATGAGSGVPGAQVRVFIKRPHSIGR